MKKASDVQELIAAQEIRPLIAATGKLLGEDYNADLETMFANLLYEGLPQSETPEDLLQLEEAYSEIQEKEIKFLRFARDVLSVLEDIDFLKVFDEEDKKFIELFISELQLASEKHVLLVGVLYRKTASQDDKLDNIKEAYEKHFDFELHMRLSVMFNRFDSLMNEKYKQKIDQYAEKKVEQINQKNRVYELSFSRIPKKGPKKGKIYVHKKDEKNILITILDLQSSPVSFELPTSIKTVKSNEKAFRVYIIDEAAKKEYAKKEKLLNMNSDRMIVRLQDTPRKINGLFSSQYTIRRGMMLEAFYKHVDKSDENKLKLDFIFRAVNKTKAVSNRAASGEMKKLMIGENNHQIVSNIQAKVKSNKLKELIFNILKHVWAVVNFDTLPPNIRSRKSIDFSRVIEAMKVQVKNSLYELKQYLESKPIGDFSKDGVLNQEAIEKPLCFIREVIGVISAIDNLSFKDTISRVVEIVDMAIESQVSENLKEESLMLKDDDKEESSERVSSEEGYGSSQELGVTEEMTFETEGECKLEEKIAKELDESEDEDKAEKGKKVKSKIEENVEAEEKAEEKVEEKEKKPVENGSKNLEDEAGGNLVSQPELKPEEISVKKVKPNFFTYRGSICGFFKTSIVDIKLVVAECKKNSAAALFILAQAAYVGDGMKKDKVTAYYAALLALETTRNHNDHLKIMAFIKKLSVPKENMPCESIEAFNAKSAYNDYIVAKEVNNHVDSESRVQFNHDAKLNVLSDRIEQVKEFCSRKDPRGLYLLAQAAYRGDGVEKDLVAAYYLALAAFKETKSKDSQEKIIQFLRKLPVPNVTDQCKKGLIIKVSGAELGPKQFYEQEKKASVAIRQALSV